MCSIVVHVHVHDLHYHEHKLLMRRNGTWKLFVLKASQNMCYLTQKRIPWKYSPINFQQYHPTTITFSRYWMTLKQNLHDKNIITKINAMPWEMKLLVESLFSHDLLISLMMILNPPRPYCFYFFTYGSEYFLWWLHQMELFSALLAVVRGFLQPPVNSPHKYQSRGALMFSLICAWTNGWVNNRDVGDLRRHCTHYNVTVMIWLSTLVWSGHFLFFVRGHGYFFLSEAWLVL